MNIREMIAERKQKNIEHRAQARQTQEHVYQARMKAHKEQQVRMARETEKANADREISRVRKYGSGFGGRVNQAMEGIGSHMKQTKAKSGKKRMGLASGYNTGSTGIGIGVNRGAFELGGSGGNAGAFSLGGGGGNRNVFELGPSRQAPRQKRMNKGKSITIRL